MLKERINILNFDNCYLSQDYYRSIDYNWIDLSELDETRCYCSEKSELKLEDILSSYRKNKVSFIGSGDYHYVSYILLKFIDQPFSLLVFDNHTDMQESVFGPILSCGSWILAAAKNIKNLRNIIIIGVNSVYIKNIKNKRHVYFFSRELDSQPQKIISYIDRIIKDSSIYISIDKDVLAKGEVYTNWDQGFMEERELEYILKFLLKNKDLVGIDICGEYHKDSPLATRVNNEANKMILNTIFSNI